MTKFDTTNPFAFYGSKIVTIIARPKLPGYHAYLTKSGSTNMTHVKEWAERKIVLFSMTPIMDTAYWEKSLSLLQVFIVTNCARVIKGSTVFSVLVLLT